MPNQLSTNGLTVMTVTEIIADLTAGMQAIYGNDINVDSNSPDGQLINLYAQVAADILEVLVDVYNSFAVDSAYGTVLDQRVALNGLAREAGTYTTTYVLVTVNQALTLYGQDQTDNTPFTVSDNAGNQYQLVTTKAFGAAGLAVLEFKAVTIGKVEVVLNTITNQVTTVLGVTSVNNPGTSISTTGDTTNTSPLVTNIPSTAAMVSGMLLSGTAIPTGSVIVSVDSATQVTISNNATGSHSGETILISTPATTTGINEETDTELKIRHAQSFALASTGPADAVEAALLALPAVAAALVIENFTGGTVAGTLAHSIWCIVGGGASADIAQAIYAKKMPGCGMRGSQNYTITRPNGTTFVAQWDVPITQPLYIKFSIIWRGAVALSNANIITALAAALSYTLNQKASVGDIVTAMATIAPTAIVDFGSYGVSKDNASFSSVVSPDTAQYEFTVSEGNITIL